MINRLKFLGVDTMNEKEVTHLIETAYKPAAPRPAFVVDLKHNLVRTARIAFEEEALHRQHQWIMLAAGLGGLVYVTGMFAVGVRLSLWVFGLVAVLMGWKKRTETHASKAIGL
jgi:hypothetical protein